MPTFKIVVVEVEVAQVAVNGRTADLSLEGKLVQAASQQVVLEVQCYQAVQPGQRRWQRACGSTHRC